MSDSGSQIRTVLPESAIQAGAQRVFVVNPRVFSFSARPIASLRHPYLPLATARAEEDTSKRQFQSRGERLADLITPNSAAVKFEEERWTNVGFMLDTVIFEAQVSARREALLSSPQLVRAMEAIWSQYVVSPATTLTFPVYEAMHLRIYEQVTGCSEACLTALFKDAIATDFVTDTAGAQTVSFSRFFMSFLEIADNWMKDPDTYATFLLEALQDEPARGEVSSNDRSWSSISASLRRHALALNCPVIRATHVNGSIVYETALQL